MAATEMLAVPTRREIFTLSKSCESLFLAFTDPRPGLNFSAARSRAEVQQQRFYLWISYMGVFADYPASLDKRLELSDEIYSLFTQLLSLMRTNLEFITRDIPGVRQAGEAEVGAALQGTHSEALNTIEAIITRLNRISTTIRHHPAASLENRVKAFTDRHGDGNYIDIAKIILRFKYRDASSSLQDQLAASMLERRQRLRYIRRHQYKLASEHDKATRKETVNSRPETKAPYSQVMDKNQINPETPPDSDPNLSQQQASNRFPSPLGNKVLLKRLVPVSATNQSGFKPSRTELIRLQSKKMGSVVSSSNGSNTPVDDALGDFPDPPRKEPGEPEPLCPYCHRHLQDSELKPRAWRRHVNSDLRPFICISEKCSQSQQVFPDFEIWSRHMREAHTSKWAQLIHKPSVWRCDVDHIDTPEICPDEESFEQHLHEQHEDCGPSLRKAIARSSRILKRRPPNVCPLCGFDVSASSVIGEAVPAGSRDTNNSEKQSLLENLAKHVAGHLQRLAYDSIRNLDGSIDGETNEGSVQTSNAEKPDEPRQYSHSGLAHLSAPPSHYTFDSFEPNHLDHGIIDFDSDIDWNTEQLDILAECNAAPETDDFYDWPIIIANLEEHMNPKIRQELKRQQDEEDACPDMILLNLSHKQLLGHKSAVFSPNGRLVAPGPYGNTVGLWDTDSGACKVILEGHSGIVTSVAFSPDEIRVASGSHDETVRLWDADSGACTVILQGHSGVIAAVAFSPNGGCLASGSHDKTVRLWDINSGACTMILQGHIGIVTSVAFCPNSGRLASGSHDETVRLWNADSSACIVILKVSKGLVTCLAFSPDGHHVASASHDNTIHIWNADSGICTAMLDGQSDWVTSALFIRRDDQTSFQLDRGSLDILDGCRHEAERAERVAGNLDFFRQHLSPEMHAAVTDLVARIASLGQNLRDMTDRSQIHLTRLPSATYDLNILLFDVSETLKDIERYYSNQSDDRSKRWRTMHHDMAEEFQGISLPARIGIYNDYLNQLYLLLGRSSAFDINILAHIRNRIMEFRKARDIPPPSGRLEVTPDLSWMNSQPKSHWAELIFRPELPMKSRFLAPRSKYPEAFGPWQRLGQPITSPDSRILETRRFGDYPQLSVNFILQDHDAPYLMIRTLNRQSHWFSLYGAHELTIARYNSDKIYLYRWSKSEQKGKVWACLNFEFFEELVLFYNMFICLKLRSAMMIDFHPKEIIMRDEVKLFSALVEEEDRARYALAIHRDNETKRCRLQMTLCEGQISGCPIWTAFVPDDAETPHSEWLQRGKSEHIILIKLYPYIFCDGYSVPSTERDRQVYKIFFVYTADAEAFSNYFLAGFELSSYRRVHSPVVLRGYKSDRIERARSL